MRFFLCFLILTSLYCEAIQERHQYVSQEVWDSLSPYFMPDDHPIKTKLDKLFSKKKRVIANQKSLKKAGFKNTKPQKYSKTIVAKHSKFKGYLFKMFTDDQFGQLEWARWKNRVLGAIAVQDCIDRHGYHHLLKVPKKWIYPLPPEPSPPNGYERKNFILVVEDMNIVSNTDNYILWKTKKMTPEHLEAIYIVLKEEGLSDTVYAFNLPFSKDGKIAFVDTEYHHIWPVHFGRLFQYLTQPMRDHLSMLIQNS